MKIKEKSRKQLANFFIWLALMTTLNIPTMEVMAQTNAVTEPKAENQYRGVLNGKATSLPAPIYPRMARKKKIAGTVKVKVVIDVTGNVFKAEAVSGPALLRSAATSAAMKATFSPTYLDGKPVLVSGYITYNFK